MIIFAYSKAITTTSLANIFVTLCQDSDIIFDIKAYSILKLVHLPSVSYSGFLIKTNILYSPCTFYFENNMFTRVFEIFMTFCREQNINYITILSYVTTYIAALSVEVERKHTFSVIVNIYVNLKLFVFLKHILTQ